MGPYQGLLTFESKTDLKDWYIDKDGAEVAIRQKLFIKAEIPIPVDFKTIVYDIGESMDLAAKIYHYVKENRNCPSSQLEKEP